MKKVKSTFDFLNQHHLVVFLLVAILSGTAIIFSMFPLSGSDEIVHFPRAYQVQMGHSWGVKLEEHNYGDYLPEQIAFFTDSFREQVQSGGRSKEKVKELQEYYSKTRLNHDDKTKPVNFTSATVYSPWAYFPAALGVKVAKGLDLPIIWYVYLARICCLVVWIALTCLAIRLMPFGKLFLVTLALLPTSLTQASTIGLDGVVNGLCWVIIASTFGVLTGKVKLTRVKTLLLIAASMFLSTTKQGYLFVAAFPLVLAAKHFPFKPRVTLVLKTGWIVALAGVTAWYISKTGPIASIMHFVQRPDVHIDSGAQLRNVLSHPISVVVMILLQPFMFVYGGVYASLVGVLTNLQLRLPYVIIGLTFAALAVALISPKFTQKERYNLRENRRFVIASLFIMIVTFGLINLALYLTFTKVGLSKVEGVQGRYFLPILPLLVIFPAAISYKKRLWLATGRRQAFVYAVLVAGLMATIVRIRIGLHT